MNRPLALAVAVLMVLPIAVFAQTDHSAHGTESAGKGKILHYRNPMGLPDTSPTPKKDAMGMDYVPVYADDAPTSPAPAAPPADKGKILYYRNPMGLPDTSPVPKKDAMGMDYVPVYASDAAYAGTVAVSPDKIQTLGVRTEAVSRRTIARTIQAVGTVAVDERRQFVVAPKFEAWIDTLKADTTGAAIKKGQPLMEVYSPELVLAQQEYDIARRGGGAALAEASLQRLRNLDVAESDIERLRKGGKVSRTLTYRSPADGVIIEKTAVRGMRFMPGEALYRIADLSNVWLIADVFEQDLAYVKPGQPAKASIASLPGKTFDGTVSFVYPTLAAGSRTAKVRIELPNPDGLLRPNLYATVRLDGDGGSGETPAIPDSALLDTGARQAVLVEAGEGRFQPRAVKAGTRADGYVQILSGLSEGEKVVVRANFLIDSEANLRSALGAFGGAADAGATP